MSSITQSVLVHSPSRSHISKRTSCQNPEREGNLDLGSVRFLTRVHPGFRRALSDSGLDLGGCEKKEEEMKRVTKGLLVAVAVAGAATVSAPANAAAGVYFGAGGGDPYYGGYYSSDPYAGYNDPYYGDGYADPYYGG